MRNLKRALGLALTFVMLLGMMAVGTSAASYPDVETGSTATPKNDGLPQSRENLTLTKKDMNTIETKGPAKPGRWPPTGRAGSWACDWLIPP